MMPKTNDATGPTAGSVRTSPKAAPERLGDLAIVAAVASTFGPYLIGGVRADQFFFYSAAMGLVVLAPWTWLKLRPTRQAANLGATWLVYALIGVIASLGAPSSLYPPGSRVAGLGRLLLPLAVMATVWLYVSPQRRERALLVACRALVWLTAVNGVVAAASSLVDLSGLLRPFWAGTPGSTVAQNAAQLGRLSGVFNQPAEAGLMYGLAGLAAVYVYRDRPLWMYLMLVPIFVGGVLCVSKVFLLAAGPVILLQVWRTARSRSLYVLALAFAGVSLLQSGLFANWAGAGYLQQLYQPGQQGVIGYYTAGRLGGASSLTSVLSEVFDRSPLWGFGAGGLSTPYDNGWVEALVVAGLIGAMAFTVILIMLVLLPRVLAGAERQLAWGVALVAVMASVGLPALTANRSGAALWTIVALLAVRQPGGPLAAASRRQPEAGPSPRTWTL
jgi:hypothetical protein